MAGGGGEASEKKRRADAARAGRSLESRPRRTMPLRSREPARDRGRRSTSPMELNLTHVQPWRLPLPVRGESVRGRLGRLELVLERGRGGFALLCLDGQEARSWSLGLVEGGELWLSCRVPRWPLRVALKDTLVLVPGARVRGYVHVALVPTLIWRAADGGEATVAELLPPQLFAEWDEAHGTCTQRWSSPFFQRLPPTDAEPRAVLPLTVRNMGNRMQSPETLPVSLRDQELKPCRGHVVAAPRRLCIDARGAIDVLVRSNGLEPHA